MIRTWNVMQVCAKTCPGLHFLRNFSAVSCVQQRLTTVMSVPRGGRAVERPELTEDTVVRKPASPPVPVEDAVEDELLNNRKNIPNLKVRDLLKEVPRTKNLPDRSQEKKMKPAKQVHKKTPIEKDTLQILQHRYQDPSESREHHDKGLKVRYTVLQSNDDRYRDLKALVGSRKSREREKKLVLEGRRLIMDAFAAGLRLEAIVTSDLKLVTELKLKPKPKNCPIFLVNQQTMLEWSSLTTSPRLIGIFSEPPNLAEVIARNAAASRRLPVTVVCDNIREPNNLGSVIRSCAAVSAQEVILLKGCAHPWDLKCLRGGAGAHFRVPVYGPIEPYHLPERTRPGSIFVVADNKKSSDEGNGFRWQLYDQIDYGAADHVMLVIGGETYGVSDDMRRLIHDITKSNDEGQLHDRKFVAHIPLENGVESLNTASALSIILYEMRRSLLQVEPSV